MEPNNLINRIGRNTCLPPNRLLNLYNVIRHIPSGDLLEIGCWRGGSSLMISASAADNKPDSDVYICDTFTGVALAGENDNCHKDGDFGDTSEELVKSLLSEYNLTNATLIKGIFPKETGIKIESKRFSFVHIDVDVYEGYKEILHWLIGKLNIGAIIILDDYAIVTCSGATKAVDEFFSGRTDFILHLSPNTNIHSWVEYTG